jgi:predicted nucleic-acid-binding Zn-ribbon protein
MVSPKCPHCDNRSFELSETSPSGAKYKIFLVHCSRCGAPFGSMEYYSSGALLKDQEEVLARIEQAIGSLVSRVGQIEQYLSQR